MRAACRWRPTWGLRMSNEEEVQLRCPQCESELRRFEDGSCAGLRCHRCNWAVVTTNQNTPGVDKTSYCVWPHAPTLDRLSLISRLAASLARGIAETRTLVDENLPIAVDIKANDVIHLARSLEPAGIGLRVDPPFRWALSPASSVQPTLSVDDT